MNLFPMTPNQQRQRAERCRHAAFEADRKAARYALIVERIAATYIERGSAEQREVWTDIAADFAYDAGHYAERADHFAERIANLDAPAVPGQFSAAECHRYARCSADAAHDAAGRALDALPALRWQASDLVWPAEEIERREQIAYALLSALRDAGRDDDQITDEYCPRHAASPCRECGAPPTLNEASPSYQAADDDGLVTLHYEGETEPVEHRIPPAPQPQRPSWNERQLRGPKSWPIQPERPRLNARRALPGGLTDHERGIYR